MERDDAFFMKKAMMQAKVALKRDEVPVGAVSYTHLDVYKRQLEGLDRAGIGALPARK